MKYNLKKTKTTDHETLTHCLTVIHSLLEESDDAMENKTHYLSLKKWKEAEQYLKDYIFELFKQNK